MPQEQPNATMMPIPDVTLVSDGEDEDIVDLEAMARAATAKLEKDLAEAKAWNKGIAQKKQEWVNHQAVAKKKKEDEEAAEAKWKVDKDAKKKVLENVGIVGSVWKCTKMCEGSGIELLRLGLNISA